MTSFDVSCALLGTALRGRVPEFVVEPNLPERGMYWDEEELPRVFVAPDVWVALQKAVQAVRARGCAAEAARFLEAP